VPPDDPGDEVVGRHNQDLQPKETIACPTSHWCIYIMFSHQKKFNVWHAHDNDSLRFIRCQLNR